MSAATTATGAPSGSASEVRATGYLAGCNIGVDQPPALIVNPDATTLGLLGWCWGEVSCLKSAVEALVTVEAGAIEIPDFVAAALHRLVPLESMLSHAMDRVTAEGRASVSPMQGARL